MKESEYEKWEKECERIKGLNEDLLEAFRRSLSAQGLTVKTVNNHVQNIDFYINHFLLYDDSIEAQNGSSQIGMFLGYWFPRKAMWASAYSIRNNISSLKKFYTFLNSKKMINDETLDDMKQMIKEGKDEWIDNMQ